MGISDAYYRWVVLGAGAVLVAGITVVRFCGSLSLPPKPAPPVGPTGTQAQLLSKSTASASVYGDYLVRDASAASVPAPTIADMARKLPYRVDEARHVLDVGQAPIEIAGVKLRALRSSDGSVLQLEIANATGSDLAYRVTTEVAPNLASCATSLVSIGNAIVVAKGATETRAECDWHDRMSVVATRVETIEVSPLSAWYLSQVPAAVLAIDPRVSRGHVGPVVKEACPTVVSQTVRAGVERGEIGWRDLADFYARHRCQTYQFPSTYRAFKSDGERPLPAVAGSM